MENTMENTIATSSHKIMGQLSISKSLLQNNICQYLFTYFQNFE